MFFPPLQLEVTEQPAARGPRYTKSFLAEWIAMEFGCIETSKLEEHYTFCKACMCDVKMGD